MSAHPLSRLTAEDYLATDRAAAWKSEFHGGEMFPVEAAGLRHATLLRNLVVLTDLRLRDSECLGLPGPLRVRVSASHFVYPDFQIVCGRPELTDEMADTLLNPKVVVEILSRSTADYDHGAKFALYRSMPSVVEYVLVSQATMQVEVFTKRTENAWALRIVAEAGQAVLLEAVGLEFPLEELYRGVVFE
jgi:Uma2 family endonuclease